MNAAGEQAGITGVGDHTLRAFFLHISGQHIPLYSITGHLYNQTDC
ncbi:hypothetical protein [Niabella drilacis]|uniref:Uncharacterized protein n=1 Tax=Niabella drilacis (strain DSM 25811 / CCM 8410 / CCUG 62505 / LMG 26954 / E90) TaxID=1285928 RepID=A0A1G6TH81_NIADE|nr:hypothetical protein [Niabella drilacis]SDD27695.1 hypothetical protein SAMN04487894_107194 [Niabella drilacis]